MYLIHYLYGRAVWRSGRIYRAIGEDQNPDYSATVTTFQLVM